jgi:hypothetical protein
MAIADDSREELRARLLARGGQRKKGRGWNSWNGEAMRGRARLLDTGRYLSYWATVLVCAIPCDVLAYRRMLACGAPSRIACLAPSI